MESTVFPGCNNFLFFFSPTKVVCVASHCAPFGLLFVSPVFILLFSCYYFPSSENDPTALQPSLSLLLRWFFCAFVFMFDSSFFMFFFYLFLVWKNITAKLTNRDREKPAVVHVKINCVKTKLVSLFSFSVMDYFWIALYIDI